MRKGKTFGLFILFFLAYFFFAFFFVASVLICINNFTEVTNKVFLWCGVGLVIISTIMSVLTLRTTKRIGETRFSFWFERNYPKLLVGYFLTIFALVSIKSQAIWTAEVVYDILSLQWTIFGLSLTVFLVWNVIIVEFLKNRQPKEPDSSDLLQKYKLALEKRSFSQEIETTFSTIVLLTINLFLLLVSASLIYISAKPESVFVQDVLHCTFFVTTNSIASLFLDILKPLNRDKTEMLKNSNVTKEDIDKAYAALFVQNIVEGIEEAVMARNPEKYTDEEKKELIVACLKAFREGIENKEKVGSGEQKK